MNIMEKFAGIEIKADNRISEEDKAFCLRQQEAFDKAGPALQKIAEAMEAAYAEQVAILEEKEEYANKRYLDYGDCRIKAEDVWDAMERRNRAFIVSLVRYFSKTYSVELDIEKIAAHLIPEGPKEPYAPWGGFRTTDNEVVAAYKAELNTYLHERKKHEETVRSLPLRYEQIVDEIFVQLGGYSFQEKAMDEFLAKTWDCSHNRYQNDAEKFEIKNDTLKLTGYWCTCHNESWRSVAEWDVHAQLKTMLEALAWYECGRMEQGAQWFPTLFSYYTRCNVVETPHMEKVKSVKLYKNGRVDIKFRSSNDVQEFVNTCLRRKVAA